VSDGEVLYEVRASLDKLREDMLAAQDEVKKGGNKLADIATGSAKAIGTGFAVIGGAAVAAGGYAVNLANDMDTAMNSFAASTGIAETEMGKYQGILENIYANNYGENFQDIADGLSAVIQQIGPAAEHWDDSALQEFTESAYVLRDTFGYDITESIRATDAMMEHFCIDGQVAMDLIAAGAQNGLDYSGEMIDSIIEYSSQFSKLGFTAEDMFKIFQQGADSGAWNLDKVGDAVKEFSIRAIDGSDSTKEGFEAIGLSADEMSAKFGEGGETAKAAFKETVKALASIEDPLKKDAAGVALFGTMWEDLGPDVVEQLANIEEGAYDTYGALDDIKEVKYNDLGSMLEGLKRSVEMVALPLGEMLIPAFEDLIGVITPLIEDGTLEEIISSFGAFLEPLTAMAADILPQIVDLFSQLVSEEILPLLTNTLLPALMEIFESLAPVVQLIITELLPPLVDVFTQLIPPITELITNLIPPLVSIFEALMPVITQLISSLLPPLLQLFSSLTPLIQALTPVISEVAGMLSEHLSGAIDAVMPIIQNLIDRFTAIIDFLTNVFTGNWEGAWDSIVEIVRSCLNTIPSVIESVVNAAINGVNSLINGINSLTDVVGIPAIPNIPSVSLPRFHTGGIIDFKGKYEAPILAKDGEMVLTDVQQKRLFDIANGFFAPQGNNNNSTNMQTTNVNIEHKNYFTVRDDSDIMRISEQLSEQETKDILSVGGD